MKSKSLLLPIIATAGIIGCSSSSNGQSSGGGSAPGTVSYNEVPLTISAPSVIPVLGKNATNTVMFVHNNTTKSISNISYSVLGSNSSNKIVIDPQSAGGCSVIPAGGVCRVGIVTPNGSSQGSNLIQAQYQNPNNKTKATYTQLFQYQEMNNLNNGVPFTTNTGSLALDGKGKGSRALYYYIPGNSTYKVSASTSSSAITIRDRTLADTQEAVGNMTVFAYDIDVPLSVEGSKLSSTGSYLIEVDTQSTSEGKKFSSVELGAQTVASTPIISLGLTSVANSTLESQIQVPVINSGTATATQIQTSLTGTNTGATILANNCGSELTANSGCIVTVAIPQNSTNTDNLRITYAPSGSETVSSANTSLAWYKSAKEPVIGYTYTSPTFYATQGTNLDVTLTNQITGSLPVTVQSIQFVSGASSATATASVNLTGGVKPCSSNLLSAESSCTFSVNINDSQVQSNGNGVFLLTGKKPDGSSYTRYLNVNYVASSYNSLLALTSSESGFKVLGDSASISSKIFTLINTGAAPAVLESFITGESTVNVQTSWFSTKESGGPVICKKGVTLNQGDSCNFTVAIGPVAYSSIAAPLTDMGIVPVKVTYYQTGAPDLKSTSNLYNYTILANSQDVGISNFSITGTASGDGSQANPATFKGSDTSAKTVSIEYTNTGTNPISIISLNNTANPFMWSLGGTCTAATTLQPGDKCTITYTSVVASYANSGYSGYSDNTNMNITTPEIALKDTVTGEIFVSSDDTFPAPINSKTLYANTQLAKVNNVVSQSSGSTMLYQTVTNATGYAPFQITFDAENYFNNPIAASGCSFTSTASVLSQTCTVSGNGTFSPTLQNASWAVGALLNINFGISSTNGQAVLNTPTFVQSTIQSNGGETADF